MAAPQTAPPSTAAPPQPRMTLSKVTTGKQLMNGERFGLIRLGSRMDIYLPDGVANIVVIGQKMVAGENVIDDMEFEENARMGGIG